MILHGSVRLTHSFVEVAEASEADRDEGRAGRPGFRVGRSEAETAMDTANR